MIKLICGDAYKELKQLPSESIDCCITSPPYYKLRDYGVEGQIGLEKTVEEYIEKLTTVFHEVKRILKPEGTLWVNIADCYAGSGKGAAKYPDNAKNFLQVTNKGMLATPTVCTQPQDETIKPKDLMGIPWLLALALRKDGWFLRQDIIWEKPNCMPESVKDRCTRSHEYVFMLSKSKRYYYNAESIKEPSISGDGSNPRGSKGSVNPQSGIRKQDKIGKATYTGFNERYKKRPQLKVRNKRDVWHISTKPIKDAHFATFPEKLVEPCLLAGCPEGGTAIDPFCGSATVGVVAIKQDKSFIGIELNANYITISKRRLENARLQKIQSE